jgi:AcrR family transcriptional regulator
LSIRERKKRHQENLRQAILDAAETLFVRQGFENVSMRKIAARIEYSPTTIYLYFKDKQDIFSCLLEQYFKRLLIIMRDIQKENEDAPIACIEKGMRAYVSFGLEHPNYYKLAFLLTPHIDMNDYQQEGTVGNQVFDTLRANVAACIKKGLFRKADVDMATQVIWSMNHGLTSLLITNPNFPWAEREQLVDAHIACAINGMRA